MMWDLPPPGALGDFLRMPRAAGVRRAREAGRAARVPRSPSHAALAAVLPPAGSATARTHTRVHVRAHTYIHGGERHGQSRTRLCLSEHKGGLRPRVAGRGPPRPLRRRGASGKRTLTPHRPVQKKTRRQSPG